jgi:methionyl-tRNA synthetase
MIHKNSGGEILAEVPHANKYLEEYFVAIRNFSFERAIGSIIEFASDVNKNFNDAAPWNLKKEEKIFEMNEVLYVAAESMRVIAILLLPFMPSSAERILDLLNIDESKRNFTALDEYLKFGHKIREPKAIFPRIGEVKK